MTTLLTRPRSGKLTAADVATLVATVTPRMQAAARPSLAVIVSGGKRTTLMNRDIWDL